MNQVFDWRALLAFSAHELCDMVCGVNRVDWTDKTLRRMLKPSSGFSHNSSTMNFLRDEMLRMNNRQRKRFLKFATAVPRLVPELQLTVACKGKAGSWLPTAQTCTP